MSGKKIFQTKIVSHEYWKAKNFLILALKNISLYFHLKKLQ